ncbi:MULTISPECIES: HPr family phosphocarrier protein [Ruminococcus]|uniref:Phosphotransferase system, phosphocarrier protein HPr n=1 Tax=Ruminococcus albus (strain ATCC 27210 / DSM 20455 / JCM 14654 / NCDO 2250 / 7) TaxID=697329 RepID=E6UHF9_RUMA7|nr:MULTISPECIES: HPr family phosphocarrier protein [Ruminococcus]ADU21204.1 Phosphotransferase system, phosphocarrier protein HPr [Ruminococcus albus 7 = DSM 20455]MCR5021370.1 HPr family phosphocarrier protein [Ruminococcus sp.]
MKEFSYTIKDEIGIHARPAGNLVKLIKSFMSTVTIEKEGKEPINGTALMKLMSLGVKRGDTVRFTVEGDDEDAAVKGIEEFMKENL